MTRTTTFDRGTITVQLSRADLAAIIDALRQLRNTGPDDRDYTYEDEHALARRLQGVLNAH